MIENAFFWLITHYAALEKLLGWFGMLCLWLVAGSCVVMAACGVWFSIRSRPRYWNRYSSLHGWDEDNFI